MRHRLAIAAALALAALGLLPLAAPADQLYVAPNGDDAGPGTASQPFKTLKGARNAVRTRTADMTADIVVNVRDGRYEFDSPLHLKDAAGDSGENGHRVIYQAYGYGTPAQEHPVISGGERITGWQLVDARQGLWRANVGNLQTRQLFVDGRRAPRPALGAGIPGNVTQTATGYVTDSTAPQSWAHPEDIELVYRGGFEYAEGRCGVASISGTARQTTIVMDQPCYGWVRQIYAWDDSNPTGGKPVPLPTDVENSPTFLTAGEWHLDRSTHAILYRARAGEDPRELDIVAPVAEGLLTGSGTAAAPLHDVTFRGLTFAHSGWLAPSETTGFAHVFGSAYYIGGSPTGNPDDGTEVIVPSAVTFTNARGIVLARDRFTHLGAGAIGFPEGVADSVVRGNVIADVSGGGIEFDGTDAGDAGNRVCNNWIHDVGVEYHGSIAVALYTVDDSVAAHNQINDIGFNGIVLLSEHGGLHVRDNLIFATNTAVHDGGGVYAIGQLGSSYANGAVIEGNVLHDIVNSDSGFQDAPIALYPDGDADYATFRENVVSGNQHAFGGVAPVHLRFTGNVWDDDEGLWYVHTPEGGFELGPAPSTVVFDGNSVFPRATFASRCAHDATCAAIVAHAGLLPAYADLLEAGS
jgi:hypothetical protein